MLAPEELNFYLNPEKRVSHETIIRLKLYHDLLIKWQLSINLVGPDTIADSWRRHFLDALQLLNYIDDLSVSMVDMGSGAGFPGLVLAIAGADNVHLIESDQRKATFLREVGRVTDCGATIHSGRIENYSDTIPDIVLSRACSSLRGLFDLSSKFVSHETEYLFHKGKNSSTEIEDAKKFWSFDYQLFPSVTDSQGVVLKISNLCRRAS